MKTTTEIPVLFEDAYLLIVNKPAGVIVNRAETTKNVETVQDWAENRIGIPYLDSAYRFGEKEWKPEDEFYRRGGIVHRLDKETSGILVIAKTPEAFIQMQKQFHDRSVKKTYIALAHGSIKPSVGEIHVPVGRLPWNRNRFGVLPGGRESTTQYRVQASYQMPQTKEIMSLVELYPQSGRTHQIRVHLQYIKHPIFADFLYAGRKIARKDRMLLERFFLHAKAIRFIHPVSGENVSFEASLPLDLEELLQTLTKKEGNE